MKEWHDLTLDEKREACLRHAGPERSTLDITPGAPSIGFYDRKTETWSEPGLSPRELRRKKNMHIFNSIDEAKDSVHKAYYPLGYQIDDNGTKKLLVALRALGLIDWIEAKPAPVDEDAKRRKVKV